MPKTSSNFDKVTANVLGLNEIGSDPNTPLLQGSIYTKNNGGVADLYYRYDNNGGVVQLTAGGAGGGVDQINGDASHNQTLTTGVAGGNFNIVDAGGGSHVFNLPVASAVNTGKLSAADWSTFNAKGNATAVGVAGQAAYFNGANSIVGDANFLWSTANKQFQVIGQTALGNDAAFTLNNYHDFSAHQNGDFTGTTESRMILAEWNYTPTVDLPTQFLAGIDWGMDINGTNNVNSISVAVLSSGWNSTGLLGQNSAVQCLASNDGNGNVTLSQGLFAASQQFGTGTTATGIAGEFQVGIPSGNGSITLGVGVKIDTPVVGAGTIPGNRGLWIQDQTLGATAGYAIYSQGGQSYHAGNFGIGLATPFSPAYPLTVNVSDSATNTILNIASYRHTTSAVPAGAGVFGMNHLWEMPNSAGTITTAVKDWVTWTTSTAGIEEGQYRVSVMNTGVMKDRLRVTGGGVMVGSIAGNTDSNFVATQGAAVGGVNQIVKIVGGAWTAAQASTEASDLWITGSRVVQFSTGNFGLQRQVKIDAETVSFVGASTVTDVATLGFNLITSGTNATVTNSSGLLIQASNVGAGTLNSYGINVNVATGATNNYAARLNGSVLIPGTGTSNAIIFGGSAMQYSGGANDIRMTDSTGAASGLDFNFSTANSLINSAFSNTGGSLVFQSATFTPGMAHIATKILPTWTSENFDHTALSILPVQQGSQNANLIGLNILMTQTGAGSPNNIFSQLIKSPTLAGTPTEIDGLRIEDQSIRGGISYAVNILAQSAVATRTRAVNIAGFNVANAISFGSSGNLYAVGNNNFRHGDSSDVSGVDINVLPAGVQTISTWGTATGLVLQTGGGSISFFGATPATIQASGGNLTNNVTAGGTTDQIDDFTSLTVYATDAGAIRNDIYQLSRKLKQVNDAMRLYGLLN